MFQLYYENSSGEKGLTTFNYNEDGILDKAIWELDDGSRASLNFYTHDINGNLIAKYREFSDSLTSNQIYEYDNQGHLVAEHFERSDSVYGITNYEYDDNGKLIKANCKGLNGWFYGEITYVYDETGKLLTKRFERSDDFSTETTYLYDHQGKLTKSYRKYSNGLCAVFTYEFNHFGQLTKRFFKRTDGAAGNESYEYDENSKLVKANWENVDSWLTGIIELKYHENGNICEGYFHGANDFNAKIYFTYDNNKNLIKIHWDFSFGGIQTYIFEYEKI